MTVVASSSGFGDKQTRQLPRLMATLVALLFIAGPGVAQTAQRRRSAGGVDARPPAASRSGSRPLLVGGGGFVNVPAYYVSCGPVSACDQRTHYCDDAIGSCVRCDDDCHPGRIGGDERATANCRQKCAWWYAIQESQTQPGDDSSSQLAVPVTVFGDVFRVNPKTANIMALTVTCTSVVIAICLVIIVIVFIGQICSDRRRDHSATIKHHPDDSRSLEDDQRKLLPSPPLYDSDI